MLKNIVVKIPDTIIGLGAIKDLGDIAAGFYPENILIITDSVLTELGITDTIKRSLEAANLRFDVFSGCQAEPPVRMLNELAGMIKEGGYDLLVGVGGGSNLDITKVVSVIAFGDISIEDYIGTRFHHKINGKILPKILVPTAAGTGAEWSVVTTVFQGQEKYIVRASENIADKVIIDPELTLTLPPGVTAETGIDALAHAIEAYTSPAANIYSDMAASSAIKMVYNNLREAYNDGKQNIEARYHMCVAAAFAMNAANSSSIGLCHIIGEILGPHASVSHGTAIGLTLPHVMEYNLVADPVKFAKVAELMGEDIGDLSMSDMAAKSVSAVKQLIQDVGLPSSLREVGIAEADVPELARQCYEKEFAVIPLFNARDAKEKDITRILQAAL